MYTNNVKMYIKRKLKILTNSENVSIEIKQIKREGGRQKNRMHIMLFLNPIQTLGSESMYSLRV